MFVQHWFCIPALRERGVGKCDKCALFQGLVQLQDDLAMLAIVDYRREWQQQGPGVALTLLLHQAMTLLCEQPLPALQQVLYCLCIGRSWAKPLLQGYKSSCFVVVDV